MVAPPYQPIDSGQCKVYEKKKKNRPFAAFHSRGTKPSCWAAKVALGQDKQRKLPFKIMSAFCWFCPSATFASQHGGFVPREWKAAKGLFGWLWYSPVLRASLRLW